MNPKVFSECMKDGKRISGIFSLVFDEQKRPSVVYADVLVAGVKYAKTLTINPQWLRKVENPDFQYVYDGLIVIPVPQNN